MAIVVKLSNYGKDHTFSLESLHIYQQKDW